MESTADQVVVFERQSVGNGEEPPFEVKGFQVTVYQLLGEEEVVSEATLKVRVADEEEVCMVIGEGNGPVNALDKALRQAVEPRFPILGTVHLIDYRVSIVNGSTDSGTEAIVEVQIDTSNGEESWTTRAQSVNMIEASLRALVGSFQHAIRKA